MSDVNANIGVHIDTSSALTELKALQKQLALFHGSVSKGSAAAASAQAGLQQNLLNSINATGKFSARMGVVRTSTESFTHALEKNKLTMGQYFKYAGASTKTFGKMFKSEFDTIGKVAEERVKKMQTQYIKMGRDASGAMKGMSITPNTLNMKDYGVQTAIAAQKQALFNQLVKQGSTNLLNFGKNTQWAGRQLMVGFTVPLMYFGGAAAKVFMDLEKQTIKFKRVYGDMFTTPAQADKALEDIQKLADEYTKYGVQVTKTIEMAAQAAAMGKTGAELTAQVANATKLAVLGSVEQEQALETTISLTNAFGIAAEDLTQKINFLNAVENQTALSIEDLTIAIPKAGPVIKQLGGEVEDLAFFMTAMKEGGINASEGANALKSGLASMINPSKKASEMLAGLGINLKGIVEANKGDLKATVIGFAQALDTLDPLNRARAIEQLFGKFQFARLSTLFQNITKDGTQAAKTLQLAGASVEELAILSERELKTVEDAVGTNFKEAIEQLKVSIAPIGKEFLKAVTPIVKFVGSLLEKFNGLSDGTKKFIVVATSLVGIVGPVLLMTFGLLANGAANIIKLFLAMRQGFMRLGGNSKLLAEQTAYLNAEQLEAETVAASLGQVHSRLTQQFQLEAGAVKALRDAYIAATIAATKFASVNPGMMTPGARGPRGGVPRKYADGVTMVPGTGTGDKVPAMLTPGEGVIPAPIMKDERAQALVGALISGKLFGYETGTNNAGGKTNFTHVGGAQKIDINELLKNPDLSEADVRRLNVFKALLSSGGSATQADIYHALGFTFDASLNDRMGKAGISVAEFDNEWSKQGYRKWESSGILEMDAVEFDNELRAKVKSLAGGGVVTDGLVKKAFEELSPEMKKTPAYKTAVKKYESQNEYQVKKGLPTTVDGLEQNLKKAIAAGSLPNLDIEIVDGDELGPDGKPKSKNAERYLTKDKHVIVTRTNSSGKRVVSSFWPIDKAGESHIAMNRIGSGGKRFGIRPKKARTAEEVAALKKIEKDLKASSLKKEKVTDLGRQIGRNPGNSFSPDGKRISGVGGFFEKPDGTRVFAKPMVSEAAALAEIRGTEIARDVHGLQAPVQKMIVMKDPITGMKMIGLESVLDERFTAQRMTGEFTKDDFVKQLVASTLRGDKDLSRSNMSGNILTDVGPAGVFSKASGNTGFAAQMLSMEEQAAINLLGVKGGARRDFAEATAGIAKNMTADEYHNAIIKEIDSTLPKLKAKVESFGLSGEEKQVYAAMIKRLEDGRKVDWRKFHKMHSSVLVAKDESLQDKKTGKITKIKGKPKPKDVKPSSGKLKDDKLTTVPKGKNVVKTPKPRRVGKMIVPGLADAPQANPYLGMTADQKAFEKSLRRQSQKLQKEKMAALKLEQKEIRAQETLKRQIAKSKGSSYYNPYANSGMTPQQIAVAKSIKRNRGTQTALSPYQDSGMTRDEIAKAKSERRQTEKIQKERAVVARQEQRQVAARVAAEKRAEQEKIKKREYKKSPEYKQQRMQRMQGIGMAAGMASSAAYMTGNTGVGNALMGVSVLSMLAPMIKGPVGLFTVALVGLAALVWKWNKDIDEARKKGLEYGKALSMGKEKIIALSKVTGTVSASEAADRKRQNLLSGSSEAQRKTGQTILESDFGKGLLKDIELQANKKVDNESIAKNVGTNLATAVIQGVITTEQAKSISMALGEKLGNYEIPLNVSGNLVTLLGPNGENLKNDPLGVTLAVQEQSIDNMKTNFQEMLDSTISESNVGNVLGRVASVGLIAAGIGVTVATGGLGVGAGAALAGAGMATGAYAMNDVNNRKSDNEELSAAAVQLGMQQLSQNQGIVDSLNKQYDTKIKMAKTTAEIKKLEDERRTALDTVAVTNKAALDYLVAQKDALGEDIIQNAMKEEVAARYKDAGAMKAFADQAVIDIENMSDSTFKTTIQMEFGAGTMSPMTASKLVQMAADNEDFSTTFELLVTASGSTADASAITDLLVQAGANDNQITVLMEIISKDKKNIEANTKALAWITSLKSKYGITIDINTNGAKKIANVRDIMDKLKGDEKTPITKQVIVDLLNKEENKDNPGLTKILEQWDALANGKSTVQKRILIDYVAASDQQNMMTAYEAAMPEKFSNYHSMGAQGISGQPMTDEYNRLKTEAAAWWAHEMGSGAAYQVPGLDDQTTPDAKQRDTTLDDLLNKLKLTRDASINAQGGIEELRRVFKKATGDIKIFNGVNQQLRKLYGADSGFIDFIGGMDNATEKGYVNAAKLKKGIVELTGDGVKAMQLYKEAQLGAFGDAANEAILQAQKQRNGFVSLKSAGASSADALEMVADANFMVSLSAAKTQKEVKNLIDQFRNQKKELEATKYATDPLQYFNDQKSVMDEKFNVDERNIRAQYEPQIELQQKLIDLENEYIREKQYEMETNEEINTARLDQINSEIDALQHSMQIGIDKQLAGLSDESARYSEDIAIMNHTIESINEQYDIQEKALSRVNDINQEIIDKQKSQISLADALTSGDISAAAQAENAMRAQAAKSMATTASQNLASAREAAINGVTSASGMTMDQIQERQYQIDRTTYGLNMQKKRIEDEIAVKQEEVYQINLKRKKITDEIRGHEQAIYDLNNGPGGMADLQSEMNMYLGDVKFARGEWETAQLAIDNATVNAEDFRAKVEKAESLVNDINGYWNGIEDEKNLTVTITKIEQIIKEYAPEKTDAEIAAEKRAAKIAEFRSSHSWSGGMSDKEIATVLGLAKGGVVPKYFSVGGAARGTDIIPAMLTPGEFVVNAKSAQAAGPLLAAINSPSFNGFKTPQMSGVSSNSAAAVGSSMYNYSIGINVNQSNASADDIAKAVMTQIKYVDSQRIRGQR